MKKALLLTLLIASILSFEAWSQCGRISLIGEFNGWAGDHFMTRNPEMTADFTAFITLTEAMDPNTDGIIELKFRENADWAVNWGAADFPTGTGVQNGPNIPVPYGNYYVMFNCTTGAYTFQTTCGEISAIGEFNGWSDDYKMYRDMINVDHWMTTISFTEADDSNADGIIEMKFRQNADWAVNWGAADFPTGVGVQNGPNIPVPLGNYKITFNCATGEYVFTSTCGKISIIGEFNGWGDDVWMMRRDENPDEWHVLLTLTPDQDGNSDGIIELKFRQNADWGTNWGDTGFPTGTGIQNGPNIPVPLDGTGLTTDYHVLFNCATGAYTFQAASGAISMIGAFNGWNGDIPMNRDEADPNLWTLSRSWYANSEVKFRENKDWVVNWGNNTFPSGTGTPNGPNIPLIAGKYDVTFHAGTGAYNFVENTEICGEIGLIGDFNEWGAGDPVTDVWMVRDPMYPSQFSLEYNFTASTGLLFRMDGDLTFTDVWGGTSLCQTGVKDPAQIIQVPGGKYVLHFNCKSGDYCFERLGNSVIAPKVFAMTMDGFLNETDWLINQPVSQVIDGTPGANLNTVYFGVTYNETYLYVAVNVTDAIPTPGDGGEVFIDGNKSGGPYDDFDLHLKFGIAGVQIIHGPSTIVCTLGFGLTPTGYAGEVSIPWADLGITPTEGTQIGFDIIISDDDTGTGVEYKLAWNGSLANYENTSSFGDLLFGQLSCGCISVYNEVIGDVVLRNPTDKPTEYVGTYNFDANYNLIFRKDLQGTVTWADDDFPSGTAILGGPAIPATSGRYRIWFDCLSGEYEFSDPGMPTEGIAYADYTATAPVIDGDLSEYNLQYGSEIMAVGTVPNNNEVSWGALWDATSLYLGVQVVDAVVEGSGNPWDNDAVEYYIDGNNDKDGTYDGDFDTQLIQDFLSNSTADTSLWIKADGVQLTPDQWTAKWLATDDGYNVELRLSWSGFSFAPGRGRVIGFSLGNNDSDLGLGRDYQTVWYGTGDNWNNTGLLGDLQLAGGPYFYGFEEIFYNTSINLYPNPSSGNVYLQTTTNDLNGHVDIYVSDISGKTIQVINQQINGINNIITISTEDMAPGMYIVNIITESGKRAVKKLIVY